MHRSRSRQQCWLLDPDPCTLPSPISPVWAALATMRTTLSTCSLRHVLFGGGLGGAVLLAGWPWRKWRRAACALSLGTPRVHFKGEPHRAITMSMRVFSTKYLAVPAPNSVPPQRSMRPGEWEQ